MKKEYWTEIECIPPKIPMPISKDILKNNQPERLNKKDQLSENFVQLMCDSPTSENK